MNKKIILTSLIVLVGIVFLIAFRYSKNEPVSAEIKSNEPLQVSVQSVKDSKVLIQNISYPALTAGDQEVTLTAQASGIITKLNFNLGSKVAQGAQLLVIDNAGNFSDAGENNLQNSTIQALELSVKSAEESYKLAKDNYKEDDTYANKKAKEIASLSLQTAKVNLKGALDTRFVAAPISGTITQRPVSQGDSVSVGQVLAKISKTGLTKVQFFIDKSNLADLKVGTKVKIQEDDREVDGIVSYVAAEADSTTHRFLVEAKPASKEALIIGNVITISLQTNKTPSVPNNLILPLSIVTVGQNENYIFIVENGKAKKVQVEIVKVLGEAAEIKADLAAEAQIITDGSKLVHDGDIVSVVSDK